jgi:hypothetical protein
VAYNAFMGVLAVLFMAAPLVLAVFIDRQVAAFQKEAFGHLRKAARNLRIMAWGVFVFYVGVLAGSALLGELQMTMQYPTPAPGVQIYVRISAAIVAYVFAFFVAKELYQVTLPGQRRG